MIEMYGFVEANVGIYAKYFKCDKANLISVISPKE